MAGSVSDRPGSAAVAPEDVAATASSAPETDTPKESAASTAAWRRTFTALRHRDFALLMAGTAPSMMAMQMGQVAFGYLAYELTGSATALGLMGLAWGLPMLTLSLIGGVAADRFPRRSIVMSTQVAIGTAAATASLLVYLGQIQFWHLFAVAVVQGTAFSFNMPARQALIADLVGRDNLANALALTNANMNMTRVVGPALGGILIAAPAIGVGGVFALMALCYVVAIATLFQLRGGRVRAGTSRGSGKEQMLEGLRYIRSNNALLVLLVLGFMPIMLGMHYQTLMPVFALGEFNAGPEGLGLMSAAAGVGALLGSLGLASLGDFSYKARLQTITGIAFGVALLTFALAPVLPLAIIALTVVGGASAAYMALNNTLIMESTPRQFYGRVMSVYMMTFSLMPLASLPAARLADTIGARPTVGISAVLLATLVGIVALRVRRGPQATDAPAG